MAVRSVILVPPLTLSTSDATLYTCPAGVTALVKSVAAHNKAGVTAAYALGLRAPGSGVTNFLHRPSMVTLGSRQDLIWWVLEPGWILRGVSDTASAIVVGIFGAELDGVAP